ncbi:hypothetical protein [Pseudomonas putida]
MMTTFCEWGRAIAHCPVMSGYRTVERLAADAVRRPPAIISG